MGAAPHHATVGVPADSGSAALGYLESLPTMDGGALPPRADAPRTVVLFFASW